MLELICGRMLLPVGDDSERGLLVRVERLERAENLAPMSKSVPGARVAPKMEKEVSPVKTEPELDGSTVPKKVEAVPAAKTSGAIDVAALRRMWPDVIEDVKKRRRLTWSLLSTSAQILALDEKAITIAIVNSGARDSFIRSASDEILRQAFIDVVGVDRKIEVVVDPSINPNTPQARAVQVDESFNDADQLSGHALLARELGAQVISETKRP
jgi:DNA polymerase-3 subunit gamma/tau